MFELELFEMLIPFCPFIVELLAAFQRLGFNLSNKIEGSIEFSHVDFSYSDDSQIIFNDLNLKISCLFVIKNS